MPAPRPIKVNKSGVSAAATATETILQPYPFMFGGKNGAFQFITPSQRKSVGSEVIYEPSCCCGWTHNYEKPSEKAAIQVKCPSCRMRVPEMPKLLDDAIALRCFYMKLFFCPYSSRPMNYIFTQNSECGVTCGEWVGRTPCKCRPIPFSKMLVPIEEVSVLSDEILQQANYHGISTLMKLTEEEKKDSETLLRSLKNYNYFSGRELPWSSSVPSPRAKLPLAEKSVTIKKKAAPKKSKKMTIVENPPASETEEEEPHVDDDEEEI